MVLRFKEVVLEVIFLAKRVAIDCPSEWDNTI